MNINEFAEQIVFGDTLNDKLLVPGKFTFERRPTARVDSLCTPGRPEGLRMHHETGKGIQPPSDERLENEKSRGQLLHFLANHELLATELMALVLLKFPDAPRAFRQGVLVTLQEEQEHTRMYLRRMKECGVEFGSYPVSGQFWRVVEPMRSPMDFVSRLSLTFEQANLDYSLHFAEVFGRLGDTKTSTLLQKIYEDEIGHVQHGLHWFRQWKNPEQSDWDAYQESLDFPLSPQRARGPRAAFNRPGRLAAGLDEDFVDAIEVFRLSRGRAPTLRWFDPAVEVELSGELNAQNRTLMQQLGRDLELLMVTISKQDDVVLVRRTPSQQHKKQLLDAGFDLPEFVLFESRTDLNERKLHDFEPWAWSPENHEFTSPLLESIRHVPKAWQAGHLELYRKSWSTGRLKTWLQDTPTWFADASCHGREVNDKSEVEAALAEFQQRGFRSAVFKKDLAGSGRGQRRLSCLGSLTKEDLRWLDSAFGSLNSKTPLAIVEPELKRLVDLSFLWNLTKKSEAVFCGWTRPLVARGRRYLGARLGTPFSNCNSPIKRFLVEDRCKRLREVRDWLESRVLNELKLMQYSGRFGVDAFVFEDSNGKLAIKPMVELNPRTTMGHVALQLEKRLAPGVTAEFRIFSRLEWNRIHKELEPAKLMKSNDGHWKSGVVRLGEVSPESKLVPVVLVGGDWSGKY